MLVTVVAPIGRSDHSSLSIVVATSQAVPNLCMKKEVFLKSRVNWDAVRAAVGALPWRSIWTAESPVELLNVHLSAVVGR